MNSIRIGIFMAVVWCVAIGSCASSRIKTWFLDARDEKSLIRRDPSGAIAERKAYVEADGYRCYSAADDEAWRVRMAQCCADNR